jgi:hypothetical protein
MKSIIIFFCISLIASLASCSNKKQSADQLGDLTALQDFPKEWVLVDDIAPPDSITRNYVILTDSSNSFIGGISIKKNGNDWEMTNSGFYYPGTYLIKSCKRTNESEMVYYDFDLQSKQDTITLKFKVNFRHNPGQSADVPSVFTCNSCEDHPDVLLAEKAVVDQYTKKSVGSLQYD